MARRNRKRRRVCYSSQQCPFCGEYGVLGFFRCAGGRIVLVCDECDALFQSPDHISADQAILDPPSARDPDTGWATREEVEQVGWGARIAGEYERG
jgi:hypothetical protein